MLLASQGAILAIISRNAQAAAAQLAEETGAYLVVLMGFI